jgi:glycosyltransferase involved in cell wall biosynthesis
VALAQLRARLEQLELGDGDSVLVVDNTPAAPSPPREPVPVLLAAERATPGYARNRGVARGSAEWLLFNDADVVAPPDLLDRYFDPAPAARTALVGGEVIDEVVPPGGPPAARYAHLRRLMSQDNTFSWGDFSFPQTSNVLCRRAAFEQVGGFREELRAAEDADLAYRLKAAGWEVERREQAAVVHRSRTSLRRFLAQQLLHGAGGAWLDRHYPGSVPGARRPGLVWWAVRAIAGGLLRAARERDRDQAIWALFDPLENVAYELGRSFSNERPPARS